MIDLKKNYEHRVDYKCNACFSVIGSVLFPNGLDFMENK